MGAYKAAVIGCGRIGFGFDKDPKRKYIATHAGAYNAVSDTELVAVCDMDERKARECQNKLAVPESYAGFKEMLKNEKIDILSICTPPNSHHSILREAVKHPLKAIFCEKPLADNTRDAERMVKLCRNKNIILQIDHQRRFDPLHINLRKLIKNGSLGSARHVNFYYTAGVKNTGSHVFDLLRFFFGEIDWTEAFFSKNSSHKKNDPNVDCVVKFKNGIFAAIQSSDAKKYLIFEIDCFLEKGRFVIKNSGFSLDFYTAGKSKYFSGYKELQKTKPSFNTTYRRDFMVNAVKHLVACVKTGKDSISSGIDGLMAFRCVEAAILSAENNGKRIYIKDYTK